jgi:hypothetical protein
VPGYDRIVPPGHFVTDLASQLRTMDDDQEDSDIRTLNNKQRFLSRRRDNPIVAWHAALTSTFGFG